MMGKSFTVVPMVMMVEGVLAGNCGPILYPFKEMAVVPQIWNSKPVVVYHPEADGTHGSACTPEELTVRSIGTIMNTKAADGKLTAEAWLDLERVELVDNRVAEAIVNKTMMELSTGLYMDVDDTSGEWNGTEYDGIASNFRPDHLAVLPDIKGASSIEDGAGFIRVNMKFDKIADKVVDNELSNDDTRTQLSRLIDGEVEKNDGYAWIEDVYSTYFIYEHNNILYKREYETESDGTTLKLVGLPIAVVRVMTYELVKNELKGNSMNKEKIVGDLIANESTQWTEEDRDVLMSMNDDALAKMSPVVKDPEKTDVQVAAENGFKGVENADAVVAPVSPAPVKILNVKEHIATLPKEIQEVLNHGLVTYNEKRNSLIAIIRANERNTLSEEFLKTKDIKELQAIANLCEPIVNEDTRFDFSLQAPVTSNSECPEPALGLPSTSSTE